MEPFIEACLEEDSRGSLLHLALRIKQLPSRIWSNHAREEPEMGDGKDVGPEQRTIAKALALLKRNKLGPAMKQLEGLGLALQDEKLARQLQEDFSPLKEPLPEGLVSEELQVTLQDVKKTLFQACSAGSDSSVPSHPANG